MTFGLAHRGDRGVAGSWVNHALSFCPLLFRYRLGDFMTDQAKNPELEAAQRAWTKRWAISWGVFLLLAGAMAFAFHEDLGKRDWLAGFMFFWAFMSARDWLDPHPVLQDSKSLKLQRFLRWFWAISTFVFLSIGAWMVFN